MSLSYLEVNHFRNLHQVVIEPDAELNIITGLNAAGKTSLLESIFYLSYGRTFRQGQYKDLIMNDQDYFRLISKVSHQHQKSTIGIQRSSKEQLIRVNQRTITRLSDLSSLLPVIALHPDSHQLLSAGPENRRHFMDWGVFHVEHSFLQIWKNYRKALSQRNAALRCHHNDRLCNLWNHALIENAELIDRFRNDYLNKLNERLSFFSERIFPDCKINLEYKKGWPEDISYQMHLEKHLSKDREKGFTQCGPHRSDIKIKLDNKSAQTSISRGQQKKLVALLRLAQLDLFVEHTGRRCILLYDDLPAELDANNRRILMEILSGMQVQLFITAIETSQLDYSGYQSAKMFHVEHGIVSTINN
ncbi:MAG: DNA replication/repair protein RecF [Gammaproteobacteria bacterium]|nr:DNA replication/repair protein RecF [Gammaproteobacteria bacterium]